MIYEIVTAVILAILLWALIDAQRSERAAFSRGWDRCEASLMPQLERTRAEAKLANDRLLAAWRDGYTVPSLDDEEPSGASDPLLSPAQTEWLDQWEDPQGRARWEAFLVRRMRAGASPDGSIADAELQVIRGQESLLTPQPATSAVTLG